MIQLNGEPLTLDQIEAVALDFQPVSLGDTARSQMTASRQVIDEIIAKGQVVYGVNTGFGKLSDVTIPNDKLKLLQLNLVRSHACGVGPSLEQGEVRAMLLLRANVLAKGFSGARPECAEQLVELLNQKIHPVVPSRGSVGASGDLAPLAHLALVLIGEGTAEVDGEVISGAQALAKRGLTPLELGAKEGLALLNGTQAMGAVGALALIRALRLVRLSTMVGTMTIDALRDTPAAFDERIQAVRPHAGQIETAKLLRETIEGSEIRESHRYEDNRVQDAYSIRCMPQVHGAVLDVLKHVQSVLEIESGSGTDNPLVFANEGDVISGGNFHGAPLAYAFDYASIVLTDLGSIIERRIERLVNPDLSEGLPAFLAKNPGMESGFMMAQVTAAALLCECRVLAHPSSCDNTPTSAGKEDHVSMGMTGALKMSQIVGFVERILAIEFLAAAEGVEHRRPLKSSPVIETLLLKLREVAPKVTEDRALGIDIESVANEIRAKRFTS
ncbi:MAG: histidine ammonia-lyase [Armatimonadetes bacterium]|nr:histidine ammonia-lyase [Armatimonadota bacterium]